MFNPVVPNFFFFVFIALLKKRDKLGKHTRMPPCGWSCSCIYVVVDTIFIYDLFWKIIDATASLQLQLSRVAFWLWHELIYHLYIQLSIVCFNQRKRKMCMPA